MPDAYEPNTAECEIAKSILQKFIEDEFWYKPLRRWRATKGLYGTGVWFTGLRMDFRMRYTNESKDGMQVASGYYDKKYKKTYVEEWKFCPSDVPLMHFLIDENAIYQTDFDVAEDCVMIETVGSKDEMKLKYGKIKQFDKDAIDELDLIMDENPEYGLQSAK